MECEKHFIAIRHGGKRRKECCESELCDLKPSCTSRIVQCRISSMQPFNDTFSHCALSLLLLLLLRTPPKKQALNGCFLSMTLSPLNASFRFGSTFRFYAMLLLLFTGGKSLCFQQCFLQGFTFYNQTKPLVFSHFSSIHFGKHLLNNTC